MADRKQKILDSIIDLVLDLIEEKIKSSKNKIDDAIALPILAQIREAFGVPDNDDEDPGDTHPAE